MKFIPLLLPVFFFLACAPTEQAPKAHHPTGEIFRSVYHFTPPSGWMNDPNGMVYYAGEYHLFYQHYPDSNVWGPMHWGHAISTDLVHWEQLPIALYPDSLGYIFSGSAVIDWQNSSGFSTGDEPPMVAIFTHHHPELSAMGVDTAQYQSLAFSNDRGRTWEKFAGNPVLPNPGIQDFRDPKVFWHELSQQWIMILAVMDRIHLYGSPNLKEWTFLSEFGETEGAHGGVWECPDLFALTDPEGNEKWIMLVSINPGGPQGGSATQYFVGSFDGFEFIPEDDYTRWIDVGADNYAGVTWSNIPASDGRRIFLGWMSNWDYAQVVPTYQWRSAMTLPLELSLTTVKNSPEVRSFPVREVLEFFEEDTSQTGRLFETGTWINLSGINGQLTTLTLSNDTGEEVSIMISPENISINRNKSGIIDFDERFRKIQTFKHYLEVVQGMDIFIDKNSLEIFVNGGELAMTELVFPTKPYSSFKVTEGIMSKSSRYTGAD